MDPFGANHADLSDDTGYEFEFACPRCGATVRPPKDVSALGVGTKLLRGISGLLGGRLGGAADAGDQIHGMTAERARAKALREATAAAKPKFRGCKACGNWVCAADCWNARSKKCLDCAPKKR